MIGEIAHSCTHGPCPHQIKVCIGKKDNDPKNLEGDIKNSRTKTTLKIIVKREDIDRS